MKSYPPSWMRQGIIPVLALISLGIGVLFWPVFFEGKIIVPGDIPFSDRFFRAEAPPEYILPQNQLLGDQISQFYVWHLLASKSIQEEGKLPLWNPYIFTGQPLVANAQSALFYPPNLLLSWLTPGQVANVRNIFNLLLAGALTFLFCREVGISPQGSILSAIAFAFSGPVLVWLGHPHVNALVWLPYMLWAGEKLLNLIDESYRSWTDRSSRKLGASWKIIQSPTGLSIRAPLVWVAFLGLGIGLSLLGGHPETTFHVLVVLVAYFLARVLLLNSSLQSKAKLSAALVVALVLGMVIGGIQLVPFADFLLQSSTFAQGGRSMGGSSWLYSKEWLFNLATVVAMVYPNFFGNPTNYNYQWPFANYQNYNEQSVYLGLIPLALAVGALFAFPRRRRVIVIALVALFCIGVAWRLPGFELINHLPIFSAALNKRLKMPFVLLVAVLAGFGYDKIRRQVTAGWQGRARSLYASGAVYLVALAILMLSAFLKVVGPRLFEIDSDTFLYHLLYRIFSFQQPKTMIPAAVAVVAVVGYVLMRRARSLRRGYGYLLIALTMIELLVLGWGYNPVIDESEMFPPVQGVEILERGKEPFRILTTDRIFWPNYPAVYGICDVGGYDLPVFLRYSDLYVAQGGVVDYRQVWNPNWPLLDFLNVRYVITPQEISSDRFVLVYSNEHYSIYENRHALPRAFMVYNTAVIGDRATMLDRVLEDEWDPGKIVLLEEPLPSHESDLLGSDSSSYIAFVRYSPDIVVLEVFTEQSGILVMSDLYSRDWQARVDSQAVELHRANYTYRAVFVPEGRHLVEFVYAPKSFMVGVGLTCLGLSVAGLLMVIGRYSSKEPASPGHSAHGECTDF